MYFPEQTLTDAGRTLIVKALNGAQIKFTGVAVGDGTAPENVRQLRQLVHMVKRLEINSIQQSDNCAMLDATYTNAGLKAPFYARELGSLAEDPDEGEILFSYANAGADATKVPEERPNGTLRQTFHLAVAVGDAENVTAVIGEFSGYASKEDLEYHIKDYNNPHHLTAKDIGLGNVPNVPPQDQQPIYPPETLNEVQNISPGEKMGTVLQKIRTLIEAFLKHIKAKNPHGITAQGISAAPAEHKHKREDIEGGCTDENAMPKAGGTFTGDVYFGSPSCYIKADGTAQFTKALGAAYNADYAEFLPRGEVTQPGDIVALDTDSPAERYLRATNRSRRVAGVHTDECAMLIGGEAAEPGKSYLETNLPRYIPVALAGRVRVRVMGPVHTGDIILPSEVPGVGRAAKPGDRADPAAVVGYAVEGDDRTDIRRLRVRIGG